MNDLFAQINELIGKGYMSKTTRSKIEEDKVLEANIVNKLN
jgi:hypothetical protein